MERTILYFGVIRELSGVAAEQLQIPSELTVQQLRSLLISLHPDIESIMQATRVALDKRYAFDDEIVGNTTELALIPPVAGG